MIEMIVSGGQTGVDRAALDASLKAKIPVGGWCPRGRLAEDGRISDRYPLTETTGRDPSERTRRNVRDSDGTLILTGGSSSAGTKLTLAEASRIGKPALVCDPDDLGNLLDVVDWIRANDIRVLNIAGPRASEQTGIYGSAVSFVLRLLHLTAGVDTDEPRNQHGEKE